MRIYTSYGAVRSLIQRGAITSGLEIPRRLEAAGLDGLELNTGVLESKGGVVPDFSLSDLNGLGLTLHSNYVDFNLGSFNPFIRRAGIEQLRAEIRLAEENRIPVLTIHPGWVKKIERRLALEFFRDSLAEIYDSYPPAEVQICLENMDQRPEKLCSTAEEIGQILEKFPGLGLTADFAHLGLNRIDIGSFLDRFDRRIAHVHVSGIIHGKPHSQVSLAASQIDLRPFLKRFRDRDIAMVIENKPWEIMADSLKVLKTLKE